MSACHRETSRDMAAVTCGPTGSYVTHLFWSARVRFHGRAFDRQDLSLISELADVNVMTSVAWTGGCPTRPCVRSNHGPVEVVRAKRRQDLGLPRGPLSRWLCIAFSGLASVGGCEHLTRRLFLVAVAELSRTASASACSDTRSTCRSRGTLRRKLDCSA